jgi:hypothetical protein
MVSQEEIDEFKEDEAEAVAAANKRFPRKPIDPPAAAIGAAVTSFALLEINDALMPMLPHHGAYVLLGLVVISAGAAYGVTWNRDRQWEREFAFHLKLITEERRRRKELRTSRGF